MFRRTGLALVAVLAAATSHAAIIDVNTLLTNPSFEAGNQASGCPVAWTCIGSPAPGFTSFDITSSQYAVPPNPFVVPDGSRAASSPTPAEGSGGMWQVTSSTYQSGDTYRLSFWLGTPLTLPSDDITLVGPAAVFRVMFVGLFNETLAQKDFATPAAGLWEQFVFDFTPTEAQVGKTVGIRFHVTSTVQGGGSGNNRIINLDIVGGGPPPVIPEPSTLALLGLGLVGIGAARRFRQKA